MIVILYIITLGIPPEAHPHYIYKCDEKVTCQTDCYDRAVEMNDTFKTAKLPYVAGCETRLPEE